MAAVLFHAPGDIAYREADASDPVQGRLRDELVREFEKHPELVTVILGRDAHQSWELRSIDPDDDDARFLAASVVARVVGVPPLRDQP